MTPDTPHDPKGAAGKLKPQLHLLPPIFCTETAAALSDGARKYGAWNFRRSRVIRSTYTSAILRHVMAIQNGEDRCPESGVTHLGHIAANCAILLDAEACGTLEDDRVLPPPSAREIGVYLSQNFRDTILPPCPIDTQPNPDNLPAINQSLRETIAAHGKTITELGELLRKTTEERDAALAAGKVKWHNPGNLTSAGEGFRFLLETEKIVPTDGEWYDRPFMEWSRSVSRGELRDEVLTYRTRQPLPVHEEPPTPVWHNPGKVVSAGEGFRFLLESEKIVPADGESWFHREWFASGNRGYERNETSTYRTRQPLPTV